MQSSIRQGRLVAFYRGAILAGIVALWAAASGFRWVDAALLPAPLPVVETLWRLLHQSSFLADLQVTAEEVAISFAIVAPVGLALGFLIGERPALYRLVAPSLQLLLATPKAIFLPIFILAFGIGLVEKILFAVALGLFAVILNGIAAVRSTPQGIITAARALGANRSQLYFQIYLPAMTPLLVEGLRFGLIFTIFGVLLSEMYGASHGLGRAIVAWGEAFLLPELLACVLLVVVVTVALNEVMRLAEDATQKRRGAFK